MGSLIGSGSSRQVGGNTTGINYRDPAQLDQTIARYNQLLDQSAFERNLLFGGKGYGFSAPKVTQPTSPTPGARPYLVNQNRGPVLRSDGNNRLPYEANPYPNYKPPRYAGVAGETDDGSDYPYWWAGGATADQWAPYWGTGRGGTTTPPATTPPATTPPGGPPPATTPPDTNPVPPPPTSTAAPPASSSRSAMLPDGGSHIDTNTYDGPQGDTPPVPGTGTTGTGNTGPTGGGGGGDPAGPGTGSGGGEGGERPVTGTLTRPTRIAPDTTTDLPNDPSGLTQPRRIAPDQAGDEPIVPMPPYNGPLQRPYRIAPDQASNNGELYGGIPRPGDSWEGTPGTPGSYDPGEPIGDPEEGGVYGWLMKMLGSTGYSDVEKNAMRQQSALASQSAAAAERARMERSSAVTGNMAGLYGNEARLGGSLARALGEQERQNQLAWAQEKERRQELGGAGLQSLLGQETGRELSLLGGASNLAGLRSGTSNASFGANEWNSSQGQDTLGNIMKALGLGGAGGGAGGGIGNALGKALDKLFGPGSSTHGSLPGGTPYRGDFTTVNPWGTAGYEGEISPAYTLPEGMSYEDYMNLLGYGGDDPFQGHLFNDQPFEPFDWGYEWDPTGTYIWTDDYGWVPPDYGFDDYGGGV